MIIVNCPSLVLYFIKREIREQNIHSLQRTHSLAVIILMTGLQPLVFLNYYLLCYIFFPWSKMSLDQSQVSKYQGETGPDIIGIMCPTELGHDVQCRSSSTTVAPWRVYYSSPPFLRAQPCDSLWPKGCLPLFSLLCHCYGKNVSPIAQWPQKNERHVEQSCPANLSTSDQK